MKKSIFLLIIKKLNALEYTKEEQIELLKSLYDELNSVDDSRKEMVIYSYLNFHNVNERNTFIKSIREFEEERIEMLKTIMVTKGTDYKKDSDEDIYLNEIITAARNIDESKIKDFINVLNIVYYIYSKKEDRLKLALNLIKNFNISDFDYIGYTIKNMNFMNDITSVINRDIKSMLFSENDNLMPNEVDLDYINSYLNHHL